MKGTRHSEEQIIAILKQGEAGLTTAELCRQPSVVTSKAAMRGQCKTGHARKPSGTRLFYSAAC